MRRSHNPFHPPDPRTLSDISELKLILQTATALGEVSDMFWNQVAGEPGFTSAGRPADNPRLKLMVERATSQVLERSQRVGQTMFIHIREHGFWHGCCLVDGKLCQVFYFEDIDSGLLTLAAGLQSERTRFVRFTAVELEIDGQAVPLNLRTMPSA